VDKDTYQKTDKEEYILEGCIAQGLV